MIKIFVDSGSSIKSCEKESLGVEILPLKIILGDKEYCDGVDLSFDTFYDALINKGLFPQTSLPCLEEARCRVQKYLDNGDQVIILAISSGISGTYNTLKMLFNEEKNVRVIDTKSAVGGIRLLVYEALKHVDKDLDFVEEKIASLIPRIRVIAIPETLDYLQKGGRLSRSAWIAGSIAHIKPLISLNSHSGKVEVIGKAIGKRRAMQALVDYLDATKCDFDHKIIPSYTFDEKNLEQLISMTDERYAPIMDEFDNLDPAIACHWGPNAFGYIFIAAENDN